MRERHDRSRSHFRFFTCDVFTDRPFTGNPLAVFPDAEGMPDNLMQRIAREFNLSETTFVLPTRSAQADFQVRIFTPAQELPFAGHPTIGTALVLAWRGSVKTEEGRGRVVLEEKAGVVPVSIHSVCGLPGYAELAVPAPPVKEQETLPLQDVAAALSLSPEEISSGDDCHQIWGCGTSCLCVPVRNLESVGRARPDLGIWGRVFSGPPLAGAYVFAYGGLGANADVHARFFAPDLGISEDPATGAAASAMGGYLGSRHPDEAGIHQWTIEQGIEMGRPSEVRLRVEKSQGVVSAVWVGGGAVPMTEGSLDVEALGV
ncbi:PhzF family phenazine biosynthesis protein [Gemmatimonadota bacterium]